MCIRCEAGAFATKEPPAQVSHLLAQILFSVRPAAITDDIRRIDRDLSHVKEALARNDDHDTSKTREQIAQAEYVQDSLRLMIAFRDALIRCAKNHGQQCPNDPPPSVATDGPYPTASQLGEIIAWRKKHG